MKISRNVDRLMNRVYPPSEFNESGLESSTHQRSHNYHPVIAAQQRFSVMGTINQLDVIMVS